MHLPFEQFPKLGAIKVCRHVFVQRIPGIDVSDDKPKVLKRLDAAHCEIRNATGFWGWPLFTAEQVHGSKIAALDSRFQSRFTRLSPSKRGEDEGEGSQQTDRGPTLILPLSLTKGEATQDVRLRAKDSEKAGILKKCQTEFPACDGMITN